MRTEGLAQVMFWAERLVSTAGPAHPLRVAATRGGPFVVGVLLPFFVTRGLLLLVGWLALATMQRAPGMELMDASPRWWINMWSHWDAGWHVSVARRGYLFQPDAASNVAAFPLYPLLIKAVTLLLGRNDEEAFFVSGILVANGALLVALAYLTALARLDDDESTTKRTVWYLLLFPASFFLSAVYSDSLFLALILASFFYARRGRWWVAGLLGFGVALSRPYGVILLAPLVLEYLYQRRFCLRAVRLDVIGLGLIPLGLIGYMAYLGWQFGEPLAFSHTQAFWGRSLVGPWTTLQNFVNTQKVPHGGGSSLVDLAFMVCFGATLVASWRALRPSYALYATLLFLVMISWGTLLGGMRYGLGMFPVFLVLARWGEHPAFGRTYETVAAGLLALFMAMFALFYWVA